MSVSAVETQRREEANAVASILVETSFIEDTESHRIIESQSKDSESEIFSASQMPKPQA